MAPAVNDVAVRPASPSDADSLAVAQERAWRHAYPGLIPGASLPRLQPATLAAAWRAAVVDPPSDRHRVLVATAGGRVVGFLALSPATDQDTRPDQDGELVVLVVDPDAEGLGHGSRLLNAGADLLREKGFVRIRVWVPSADLTRQRFLADAGLRADGASRLLTDDDDEVEAVREERWSAVLDR